MSTTRWQSPYLYLLLAFSSLLLPGFFPFSQIKVGWCLVAVFVLPGYLLLCLVKKPLRSVPDPFGRATLALAVSLALLLVPWVQVFLLRLDLGIVVITILGFDLVLLLFLLVAHRPVPVTSAHGLKTRLLLALLAYVAFFMLLTWLYGGNVFGDGYSYMTLLRNIYDGDVAPQANVHAAWESAYPFFKNIFAPFLMGFAVCARMARVDPNVVWAIAPALLTFFLFAVNYSSTYLLFRKRLAANMALLITPFVVVYVPSMLGDSHASSVLFLRPLIVYLALRYVLLSRDGRAEGFSLALVGPLGFVLAAEHLQNLIYALYSIGAFGLLTLLVAVVNRRKSQMFKRSLLVLFVILLFASPYVLWTLSAARAAQFDVANTLDYKIEQGGGFLGPSANFLIVHPRSLLHSYTTYWLGFAVLLGALFFGKRCYRTPGGRFVCSNVLIILFLGLNPVLVPFMARLITAQVVYRIGEMLPVVPVLSFVLFRAYLTGATWFRLIGWRHRLRRLAQRRSLALLLTLTLIGLAWARHAVHVSLSAVNLKVVHVVYAPEGANPNWLDRLIRQRIAAELDNPPFPILEHPTRLNRILDSHVIHFIESDIPANSVFLSDKLAEFSLPAYTNQLAFVGRRGGTPGQDVCQDVLSGELSLRRTTEVQRLIADRYETICTVLAPETDVETIENLLQRHADDVDYILVTPSNGHLKAKLDSIDIVRLIYDEDGFAIYQLDAF
jgi:hypothetical protein